MEHFKAMFNPESVAVVGASNALEKWGAGIFTRLLEAPDLKGLYPVNNRVSEVQGVKAYSTIRDLPEPVEFVVIVVPYPGVPEIVRDCVEHGVKAALIITAGLGETGTEGVRLEQEIVSTARKGGLRLIGPNCMGHFNTTNDLSTVRMGRDIYSGKIGVLSQSGGFAGHILECGYEMGAGFSKMVSLGNEADLCFEDFLEYLAQDDDTRIITGYIEGLKDGRRFFRLAREITKRKPIVVVKVGRTEAGTRAARGHTGHLAGSDIINDAMLKQAGVIRADTVEDLFDVAVALLRLPLPRGNRVGILTGGGGFGCVTSDACEMLGLDVAPLLPETIDRLSAVLPERWPHANPVDTVAAGYPTTYPCLWPLIEDDNLDAVIPVGGIGQMRRWRSMMSTAASSGTQQDDDAPSYIEQAQQIMELLEKEELENLDKLIEYMDKYQKPIIVYGRVTEDMKTSPVYGKLKENGIPMYPTPERAAKVLAHLVEYGRYLNSL